MKIPTWRFVIYLLLAFFMIPPSSGRESVYTLYAYYFFMAAITVWFMKKDSIWPRFWFPDVKRGVMKGLFAFPLFVVVSFLVSSLFPVKLSSGNSTDTNLIMLFSLLVLLSPITEEIIFRGYIQEYFRQRLKVEWAIVISALVFSLFHPFDFFPYAFVSGVFLSYLRESTGSLIPGIVVHLLNNLIGFIEITLAG
jgi:membrane protease YdiL (CAAX protease family)